MYGVLLVIYWASYNRYFICNTHSYNNNKHWCKFKHDNATQYLLTWVGWWMMGWGAAGWPYTRWLVGELLWSRGRLILLCRLCLLVFCKRNWYLRMLIACSAGLSACVKTPINVCKTPACCKLVFDISRNVHLMLIFVTLLFHDFWSNLTMASHRFKSIIITYNVCLLKDCRWNMKLCATLHN